MPFSPDLVRQVFLSSVVLYLLAECWVAARQILSAERSSERIPEGFGRRLSLAAHRKAAALTTEEAQVSLVLAFIRATLALLMTAGGGLALLAGAAEAATPSVLLSHWLLLAATGLVLTAFELPFEWLPRFRLRERFGLTRTPRLRWTARRLADALSGWLAALPVLAAALPLFRLAGESWWLLLWSGWLLLLFWRWRASLARDRAWSRKSEGVLDEELRSRIARLLEDHGLEMEDLVIMARPPLWKHAHALLVGTGRRRRVVLFAHAAARLGREEMTAVVATALGRVRLHHTPGRIFFSAAAGFAVAWLLGWASRTPAVLEGLGLPAAFLPSDPGTAAALALAEGAVALPLLCFPLRPLVSLGSRELQYAADRFAARATGHAPLERALVRLQRGLDTTLTPSRIYSLFHYERAPVFMRLRHLRADAARRKTSGEAEAANGGEQTVLAREQALRRARSRDDRTPHQKALDAAAELERALQKERRLVIDDGFEDDDGPAPVRADSKEEA